VIVAAIFSSSGKKTPAQQAAAKGQPPQPTLQDNTDNNVQDLKNQLQAQRQKEQQQAALAAATGGDPALASATPAQRAAAAAYGPTGVRRALHSGPALPASAAGQHATAAHARYNSRHSRSPRRNGHAPTTRVSLPTLCTLVCRAAAASQGPGQMMPVSQRQADSSLVAHQPQGNSRRTRPEATNVHWRQTSIRPRVSHTSFTRVPSSTRFL
jgi:hypothetical protein